MVSGWMGFLIGQFSWLANPLLIVAAILLLKGRGGRAFPAVVGVLLLVLGLQIAATNSIVDNEGGIAHAIEARYAGFWLWVAAVVLAGATSVLTALVPHKPEAPAAGGAEPA